MALLTKKEIRDLGLTVGKNVSISSTASFYGVSRIKIGDNVRIDDFVVLSAGKGGIQIGNHVHIAIYTSLMGAETILIEDFVNFSSKVSIYSSNDDYSGNTMTSPLIPEKFKSVYSAPVHIGKHTILGCGCIILPGVNIKNSCAVGALSLVKENTIINTGEIHAGVPAKFIKLRVLKHLNLETKFLKEYFDK